jgi:exodeoxyribonuclease V gamma subunit
LFAHDSGRDWSGVCIGRAKEDTTPLVRVLGHPDGDAVEVLRDLVRIYDAGRREPIPLPAKTSYAWAAARFASKDPVRAAQYPWKTNTFPGEDESPAHVRAWGNHAPLSALMQPLRSGEESDNEDNRLGAYSCRLWLPVLRAERNPT